MTRYRTVVADPPWDVDWHMGRGEGRSGHDGLPYDPMTFEDICSLPVAELAESSAHLWLWTTANFLWDAPRVVASWGFRPASYTLVWGKPGLGAGGRFRHTVESEGWLRSQRHPTPTCGSTTTPRRRSTRTTGRPRRSSAVG
jgi:N6-adenosine-specific RNA methylase IME4